MKTLIQIVLLSASAYLIVEILSPFFSPSNPLSENQKINQVQIIGSHNSYKLNLDEKVRDFLLANKELLPADFEPQYWDYSNATLDSQLNIYKLRSIELDLFYDPEGVLYNYSKAGQLWGENPPALSSIAPLSRGLKVLHYPDFDYKSIFPTFLDALKEMKKWSENQPGHFPVFVIIEVKEEGPASILGPSFTRPFTFNDTALNLIETEIRQVFNNPEAELIYPDLVRGHYPTLNKAVLAKNWPTIKEARGKFLFVLMASKATANYYLKNNPSLSGRLMFLFTGPGMPESAFISYDNPKVSFNHIKAMVKAGYIVRTRADADTQEARSGDYSRMKKAFKSGAHIISTDYYRPDPRAKSGHEFSDYSVKLPNQNEAIRNPIIGN